MKHTKVLLAIAIALTVGFVSCKPKDADIKTALDEKVKANTELAGVTVDVKEGVATLTGELKDAAAVAKAAELLKDVKGVKSITNSLTVAPPPAPIIVSADDSLNKAVTDAIKDFSGVQASVKDGVVALSGQIAKSSLIKLMMTVQSLRPKKVDTKQLIVK
ncbi:MAG: BON domain-containing protein [Bacteroidota bacterium]